MTEPDPWGICNIETLSFDLGARLAFNVTFNNDQKHAVAITMPKNKHDIKDWFVIAANNIKAWIEDQEKAS